MLRGVQHEFARHTQDVNNKLVAHDTVIVAMQVTQKETTSDIKSLLMRMGQFMQIPNFGHGSMESGTDSRD